jgi:uncharacterized BrkB/YihY/UPF0761 family membrane protein
MTAPPPAPRPTTRARVADLQDRARTVARNVEQARSDTPLIDTGFECWERDSSVAGSLLSGAVAFRLFLLTVPLALIVYALLGFSANSGSGTAEKLAGDAGLRGAVLSTMSDIGRDASKGRWITLIVGLYALVLAVRTTVKSLRISHRLAWQLPALPKAGTVRTTLAGLGFLIAAFAVAVAVSWSRANIPGVGLAALFLAGACWAALWWAASMLMPHDDDATWTAFVPGAVLFGLATQGLHLFTTLYLAKRVTEMSETYGPLGVAVVMMLWLFIVARAMTASAVVNAVLWDRRRRGERIWSPVDPALFGINSTRKPAAAEKPE